MLGCVILASDSSKAEKITQPFMRQETLATYSTVECGQELRKNWTCFKPEWSICRKLQNTLKNCKSRKLFQNFFVKKKYCLISSPKEVLDHFFMSIYKISTIYLKN